MKTVFLEKTTSFLGHTYVGTNTKKKQIPEDVQNAISKMHWMDKIGSYRTIKNVAIFSGPLFAALFNPTSFSAFSWVTPGITAITTCSLLIPHEMSFYLRSGVSENDNPLKRMAALAGNAALETSVLMVISTLARDYLYIPRYVSYPLLSGVFALGKGNISLYTLAWPEQKEMDIKITSEKYV